MYAIRGRNLGLAVAERYYPTIGSLARALGVLHLAHWP